MSKTLEFLVWKTAALAGRVRSVYVTEEYPKPPAGALPCLVLIVFSRKTRYKLESARQRNQCGFLAQIFPADAERLARVPSTVHGSYLFGAVQREPASETGRGRRATGHKRGGENHTSTNSFHAPASHERLRHDCGL